jgi:hypothetical protein
MFAINVLDKPRRFFCVSRSAIDTVTWLSSTKALTPFTRVYVSEPFGHLTVTTDPATDTSTPAGIATGFLPIFDIVICVIKYKRQQLEYFCDEFTS